MLESSGESRDDYGMRISSPPPRQPKASVKLISSATPAKETLLVNDFSEIEETKGEEELTRFE